MKKQLFFTLLILSIISSSCERNMFCIKGSGDIISENRSLTAFNKIDFQSVGTIHLIQGSEYHAEIKAQSNIINITDTEIDNNGCLIISTRKCIQNTNDIDIYITAPDFSNIELSGSGKIMATDVIDVDKIEVHITGSGDISFSDLKSSYLYSHISGSGTISIIANDPIEEQRILIDGSGDIKNYGVNSNNVDILIEGSGNCFVYALEQLDITISGSGSVYYKGSPLINQKILGSGNVFYQSK